MIDVNQAREQWLNARNPELLNDCRWQMNRLVAMFSEDMKDSTLIEFEAEFNSIKEKQVFTDYIKGLGYSIIFFINDEAPEEGRPLKRMVKINILKL